MDKFTLMLLGGVAAVLPLYGLILTSNTAALVVIFTFAFLPGLLELLLGIPSLISRAVAELCIVMLFTKALYLHVRTPGKPFTAVGLFPMMGLFTVSLLSFMVSDQSVVSFVLFLRLVFLLYIFFLTLLNLNLSERTITTVNGYLILLFMLQIPPAVVKFSLVGMEEGGGIGTVSVHAGEFSTTLPLFAMAFLVSFYLWRRDIVYSLWILVFFAFGIAGAKRALAFYVPILFLFMYILFAYGRRRGRVLGVAVDHGGGRRIAVVLGLIAVGGMYVSARTLEGLNPEQRMGGRFDPEFIVSEVIKYETYVMEEGGYFEKGQTLPHTGLPLATGRISSTVVSFQRLAGDGPVALLFGSGPGLLVGSSVTGQDIFEVLRTVGIRYGITGLVWLVNQVGLLGVVLFLAFYIQLFRKGLVVYRVAREVYWKSIVMGFLGASFVCLLDFLTYSLSTLTMGALAPAYYYVAAVCCRRLSKGGSGIAAAAIPVG